MENGRKGAGISEKSMVLISLKCQVGTRMGRGGHAHSGRSVQPGKTRGYGDRAEEVAEMRHKQEFCSISSSLEKHCPATILLSSATVTMLTNSTLIRFQEKIKNEIIYEGGACLYLPSHLVLLPNRPGPSNCLQGRGEGPGQRSRVAEETSVVTRSA